MDELKMSKDKLFGILDAAWDNGVPFIDYTKYYVYCLIPTGDGNYNEVSYDIESGDLDERPLSGKKTFGMLGEEIEKGLSGELEDFMLGTFKEFKKALGDIPDEEKTVAIIKELTENGPKYSANLPIIPSKDKLDDVKSKI